MGVGVRPGASLHSPVSAPGSRGCGSLSTGWHAPPPGHLPHMHRLGSREGKVSAVGPRAGEGGARRLMQYGWKHNIQRSSCWPLPTLGSGEVVKATQGGHTCPGEPWVSGEVAPGARPDRQWGELPSGRRPFLWQGCRTWAHTTQPRPRPRPAPPRRWFQEARPCLEGPTSAWATSSCSLALGHPSAQ